MNLDAIVTSCRFWFPLLDGRRAALDERLRAAASPGGMLPRGFIERRTCREADSEARKEQGGVSTARTFGAPQTRGSDDRRSPRAARRPSSRGAARGAAHRGAAHRAAAREAAAAAAEAVAVGQRVVVEALLEELGDERLVRVEGDDGYS